MKTPGYLLYGASVVLAAAIPYLHVSEQIYGPRQERLESRLQATLSELEQGQSQLREKSRELASRLDETSARAGELRQRTGALGETLLRRRSELESRLTRVESLRERERSLEERLREASAKAAAQRERLEEGGRCGRVRPRPGYHWLPNRYPMAEDAAKTRGFSLPSQATAIRVPGRTTPPSRCNRTI